MPTLDLTAVWINLMSDGSYVTAQSARARGQEHRMAGEVRTYAGGRQRALTVLGTQVGFTFVLVNLTTEQLDTLKLWIGEHVQVRDHRGQQFFGTYFGVNVGEDMDPELYFAEIELRVTTTEEAE
jgi:hypothetical protein